MSKCEFNKLHFGMSVLLYIKFTACIFSKHIFLRTPQEDCFWYRLFSILSSCIWKGANLDVVETKWQAKNFHKNFHDVLERRIGVEIKDHYILPWANQVKSCLLRRSGISRGVHEKPQVLVYDLGLSTNQQGQGFHSVVKGSSSIHFLKKNPFAWFLAVEIVLLA